MGSWVPSECYSGKWRCSFHLPWSIFWGPSPWICVLQAAGLGNPAGRYGIRVCCGHQKHTIDVLLAREPPPELLKLAFHPPCGCSVHKSLAFTDSVWVEALYRLLWDADCGLGFVLEPGVLPGLHPVLHLLPFPRSDL